MDEPIKFASITASFSFVVDMDGIDPIADTDTLPGTVSLFAMHTEEACNELPHVEYEVLKASLAITF